LTDDCPTLIGQLSRFEKQEPRIKNLFVSLRVIRLNPQIRDNKRADHNNPLPRLPSIASNRMS